MHELPESDAWYLPYCPLIEQESARRGLLEDDPLVALNQDLTRRLKDLETLMQDLSRLGESVKLKLQPTDLAKFVTRLLSSEQACHIAEQIHSRL